MTSDNRRDSLIQRAAESLRGTERAERLGTALADVSRELAQARRQIITLKRENAALRAQLGAGAEDGGMRALHLVLPPNLQPEAGIRDRRPG